MNMSGKPDGAFFRCLAVAVSCLTLFGCASGPTASVRSSKLPALDFEQVATLPAEVAGRLEALRDAVAVRIDGEPYAIGKGVAYEATLPNGFQLFVLWAKDRNFTMAATELVLMRPSDGSLNMEPERWSARWERNVDEVLAGMRLDDLECDGGWELVYRQREHSGTMHNELTDHYFEILGGDGAPVGFREVLAVAPWMNDIWSESSDGSLLRTVRVEASGGLVLEVFASESASGKEGRLLGRAELTREPGRGRYVTQSTEVFVERYARFVSLRSGRDERMYQ